MSDNPVYPAVSTPGPARLRMDEVQAGGRVDVDHGSGKQTAGAQTPSLVSGGHPEINPGLEPTVEQTAEIEVIPESPEISPELAEHVEKVVRGEIQLPGPIKVGKHKGEEVTISPFTPQQPNIVLPLSQSDFQLGAKQPTSSAWLWLVEWVKRIILKNPGRAVYRT